MEKLNPDPANRKQAGYPHEKPQKPNKFGNDTASAPQDGHPGKPDRDEDESHEPEEFIEPNPNWRGAHGKERDEL